MPLMPAAALAGAATVFMSPEGWPKAALLKPILPGFRQNAATAEMVKIVHTGGPPTDLLDEVLTGSADAQDRVRQKMKTLHTLPVEKTIVYIMSIYLCLLYFATISCMQ